MNKRSLRTIAISTIASIWLLSGVVFFLAKESEKKLRIRKESELAQKSTQVTELEIKLADLNRQKTEFETTTQTRLAELEAQISQHKAVEEKLQVQAVELESVKSFSEVLAKELEEKKTQIDALNKKIKTLEADKSDLLATVKRYEDERVQVEAVEAVAATDPLEDFDAVKLGKIVVQKETGQAVRVQHVDGIYGFIVVNAGSQDGIQKNNVINIVRNKKIIGKALIEKVKNNTAAAVTMPEWTTEKIQVGDIVSRF